MNKSPETKDPLVFPESPKIIHQEDSFHELDSESSHGPTNAKEEALQIKKEEHSSELLPIIY